MPRFHIWCRSARRTSLQEDEIYAYTRWFTATSVTNALFVTSEIVAQQVAAWSKILVDADTVAMLEDESDRVADPNEASVTNNWLLGNGALPKRTAVPAGDERVS